MPDFSSKTLMLLLNNLICLYLFILFAVEKDLDIIINREIF